MSTTASQVTQQTSDLNRLVNREEVLEICYWYQGEGFGDVYNPERIKPFLHCAPDAIEDSLAELHQQGFMAITTGVITGYRFTESGKKKGGRLFADSFADFQKGSHGECAAGCCDGDDHSACGDACSLH